MVLCPMDGQSVDSGLRRVVQLFWPREAASSSWTLHLHAEKTIVRATRQKASLAQASPQNHVDRYRAHGPF